MRYEFDVTIQRLEGKMAWPVLYVPWNVEEIYGTKGRFYVCITLDGHDFRGTLLPSKNGHYLVYNQFMKDACQKELGESVHVVMEPDLQARVIEIPEDVRTILDRDPTISQRFEKLPDYMKREEIHTIIRAKKQATRENRIEKLVEKLRQQSTPEK